MALAGIRRIRRNRRPTVTVAKCRCNEIKRVGERLDDVVCDDVVVNRRVKPSLADSLGQLQDVVLCASALRDRDDVSQ